MELIRLAIEAITAEHAYSQTPPGVHIAKGCHGCVLWRQFKDYVMQEYADRPDYFVHRWGCGLDKPVELWAPSKLTHREWEVIVKYLRLIEPAETEALPESQETREALP